MHLVRGTKTERWEKWAVKGSRRFCREARKYHLIDEALKDRKKEDGRGQKGENRRKGSKREEEREREKN